MRVLIVDDEPAARRRLAALIEEIDPIGIEIVGEAEDGVRALELARERTPDVILLDIAMREVDGLDVARHLGTPRPLVIFQTAYHEHAWKAFEHDALDYIVKPVRRERLVQALERARARLATMPRGAEWDRGSLEQLGAAVGHRRARPVRLLVRHGAGHRLVAVKEVVKFSATGGLVYAHTASGASVSDYTLAELEERVAGDFVRTSRADLVSVAHIARIVSNGDGSATLTLADGSLVHVSRRRAAAVREQIQG